MYIAVYIFCGHLHVIFVLFCFFFLSRCPADDRRRDPTPSYIFTRDNFQVYSLQSAKAQQNEGLQSKHNRSTAGF